MASKKKVRIVKEFIDTQFKEIKKPKDAEVTIVSDEFEEDKSENNHSNNNGFSGNGFSSGRRTAPILEAENIPQSLERVAETAPPRRTDTNDNAGNANLYSANYDAKYNNSNYETMRGEVVARSTVRASGVLDEQRIDAGLRRVQPTWQQSLSNQSQGWNPNLPDERVYKPADDSMKERTKEIDKRRRMF